MNKPPEVVNAVSQALTGFGSAGRGAHPAALAADEAVFEARHAIADLLGAPDASRVAFTLNATMALNVAIAALLPRGGSAVTTAASHNSVLRPLYVARNQRSCKLHIAPVSRTGALDYQELERLTAGANLVVVTHASNLTGDVYDIARISSIVHQAGATLIVDAAQTAGALPFHMGELGVDVVCFSGHKALFGPQGTGGLCVAEGVNLTPLIAGGTGTHSFTERHPAAMPESLEAGTPNAHGLAGLAAGTAFVSRHGVHAIHAHTQALVARAETALNTIPGIRLLGGSTPDKRIGIVAFKSNLVDSSYLAAQLAYRWGIYTRAGVHCAPLMHRSLGTETSGAVRVSFSVFTTLAEVDAFTAAVRSIVKDAVGMRNGRTR